MFGKTLSGRKLPVPTVLTQPSSYEWAILKSLKSLQGRKLYQGTVSDKDKGVRRARGKIAKASRKGNRGNR
jgi:hypothetical protein